ncbi:Arogenate dehydratase [Forsythia ovata]|uniref:Arogenate dehydratase n=1 Tax=Forsythia ovata TaxID=205694 RepID=A0ABD1T8G4_9LAMI
MHRSELRVAYQGVPGAYSKAATGKAYLNCEAIPCDQFEVAFQAVELWVADRVVLRVENSLGLRSHLTKHFARTFIFMQDQNQLCEELSTTVEKYGAEVEKYKKKLTAMTALVEELEAEVQRRSKEVE